MDYVFEYETGKQILLNFYSHNLKENIDIDLKMNNADNYDEMEKYGSITIDQEVDVLDLAPASKLLCRKEEGGNCELFMRLKNKMSVEVDITVTLLMHDAIIELKDGIWQSYGINEMSATSHFWFAPKQKDHATTIFYKSSIPDLKIMYTLWESDDKSINPAQWPFPLEYKENEQLSELTFKPLHFIHI